MLEQLEQINQHLPQIGISITFVIFLYFAYLLLKQAFAAIKNARFIEDTPTSKIRSAPQGYVEIEGQAQFSALFEQRSPVSYEPCVWYSYIIEEWIRKRVGNRIEARWEIVFQDQSPHLFLVADDTGECVVSPLGAQVTSNRQRTWKAKKLPRHLDKHGETAGKGRRFRFTEMRIDVGDELYLLGNFETTHHLPNLHDTNDYDNHPPSKNRRSLFFFFLPRSQDIQTCNNEWQNYQKTMQSRFKQTQIHLVRHRPDSRQPYLISTFSQKKLTRTYRWQALRYWGYFLLLIAFPFAMIIYEWV